jgi:cysteinyl-tRNA synthetase
MQPSFSIIAKKNNKSYHVLIKDKNWCKIRIIMTIKLHNTLTGKIEPFKPIKKPARIYACGPTVYDFAHVGNLRSYITWDILRRTLKTAGIKTKMAMNITDVGHLTSDADVGEDKIEKGAERENKTAWEIAKYYEKAFFEDLSDLNIEKPDIICRATDHIKEQIKLIQKIQKNGFAYITSDGVYFDTAKLPSYGQLANLKNQKLRAGARIDLGEKRNPTDFALWKFTAPDKTRQMEWKSPWGKGFPGWHVECSAMSAKYLGIPFDIHCGGIDHIPVHHTNEIAQTEAVEGVIPAKVWLHNEFLTFGQDKMSKSSGGFVTLRELKEKNIDPISYRYFVLQTHYRKQLAFGFEALESAKNGLKHLYSAVLALPAKKVKDEEKIKENFWASVADDLDTPGALSIMWKALKEKSISQKTALEFDKILGLKIKENLTKPIQKIDKNILAIVKERDLARTQKDWAKSDRLRAELEAQDFLVMDSPEGTKIQKK